MTSVEQIRRAEIHYVNFLWKEIGKIREAETVGDYVLALETATTLIPYLPQAIKKEFETKATQITKTLQTLSTRETNTDIFVANIRRNRLMQTIARTLLKKFIDEISSQLDALGYMEMRGIPSRKGKIEDIGKRLE